MLLGGLSVLFYGAIRGRFTIADASTVSFGSHTSSIAIFGPFMGLGALFQYSQNCTWKVTNGSLFGVEGTQEVVSTTTDLMELFFNNAVGAMMTI